MGTRAPGPHNFHLDREPAAAKPGSIVVECELIKSFLALSLQ